MKKITNATHIIDIDRKEKEGQNRTEERKALDNRREYIKKREKDNNNSTCTPFTIFTTNSLTLNMKCMYPYMTKRTGRTKRFHQNP
jgi:hypothetical protein